MKAIFKTAISIFGFLLSVTSCGQYEELLNRFPEYSDKYSSTITAGKYDAVYDIVKAEFDDFPEVQRTINYEQDTENYYLNILLKRRNIRITYLSNDGNSNNEITAKIRRIKEQIEALEG